MVKQRLSEYLRAKSLSMREFGTICGLDASVLSRINASTSRKTLRSIAQHSDLNTDWLITGNGEMLKQEPGQSVEAADAPRVPDDSQPCLAPLVDEMAAQRMMFQSELAAQRDLFKSTVDQLLALSQRLADTVNRLSEE